MSSATQFCSLSANVSGDNELKILRHGPRSLMAAGCAACTDLVALLRAAIAVWNSWKKSGVRCADAELHRDRSAKQVITIFMIFSPFRRYIDDRRRISRLGRGHQ